MSGDTRTVPDPNAPGRAEPTADPACIGLCLGACTVTIAKRTGHGVTFDSIPHDGKVGDVLRKALTKLLPARIGITGRTFRRMVALPTIPEPEAVERAYAHVRETCPDVECIVSAGGETFIAYFLDRSGRIRSVQTGNKCASGTGEFFIQQITRMGLDLEAALSSSEGEEPYHLASRCSVFCKSDCTHALNKGLAKGRVSAGLCRMMAVKITELLKKGRPARVLVTGGVSRNLVVLDFLRSAYPLAVTIPESPYFEALGAMLWAETQCRGHPGNRGNFHSRSQLVLVSAPSGGRFGEGQVQLDATGRLP